MSLRRVLVLAVVLLVVAAPAPEDHIFGPPAVHAGTSFPGDVNCDGAITAVDALQVLRSVVGLPVSAGCLEAAGDADCDGDIDSVDALGLLRVVAGLVPPPAPCAPPSSSEDLIAEALAANEIGYEQSLLYRAYALLGYPRLPEQFRSDVLDYDAGTALFAEIAAQQDSLSPETLDALAPFMARPADPSSIFSTASVQSAGVNVGWRQATAAGGAVRVWVRLGVGLEPETYAGVVNEVWPHLGALIRRPNPDDGSDPDSVNPDTAVDVYVVPIGEADPRRTSCSPSCTFVDAAGWAVPAPPRSTNTSSGYAIIDAEIQGDFLVGTVAHELFHLSQFTYDVWESAWLMEATAAWGEFRALQKSGRGLDPVHRHLAEFFSTLHTKPLFSTEGNHEYGSYLFFFFAQMEQSDAVVGDIWAAASPQGQQGTDAVDQKFPFDDSSHNFREFALRNWNDEPVPERYELFDQSFPLFKPRFKDIVELQNDTVEQINIDQVPVSAGYYSLSVPRNAGIQKVKFNLDKITGKDGAGIDAIVTIEGKDPEIEHWSDRGETSFCLEIEDQRLMKVVLIVSNADLNGSLRGAIEADTTEPCAAFSGTIHYSFEKHGDTTDSSGRPVRIDHSEGATIDFEMEADPDTPNVYQVSSGSVTWDVSATRTEFHDCESSDAPGTVSVNQGAGSYDIGPEGSVQLFWKTGEGFTPDDNAYGLQILASPPTEDYVEGDPRFNFELKIGICIEPAHFGWLPFIVFYSGITPEWRQIPPDRRMLSGNASEVIEPLGEGDIPGTATANWMIDVNIEE